ncbi:CDP-diacylglycerol--glycerol-3-phosphate 3-phosphatidyltransferase [Parasporobacterium paucivorans]|uniref:CDP-diacylglycerol--glycerol-3-phosphate 3-phosphatidyltransferase n=1 Tax=Parasporobacterium paucivorans DSM 15970 TaxID=1122934 RepID=A0A1M6IF54_9FIRM|nr:CDP-diacylglycerol--glycerol-3-phosphate 3-phosphatidyltransferase [Parasporobacterium paucivorans]SHJ33097.1 CDP-diacylglycerol--glycerol-3-phosphate 3-phosphatidyltransferase [Parasporobacterium paucivorans DSM 15970]
MKYVPNAITLMRLVLIPIFAYVYLSEYENAPVYAVGIFLLAGFTDLLDGYLARKYNVVSIVGIVLDPLADKLMLLTALLCFVYKGIIPLPALIIMLVLEGALIVGGIYLYMHKTRDVVPAGKTGKAATVFFTVVVVLLILIPNHLFTQVLLWVALALKVISFTYYTKEFINGSIAAKKKNS